MRTDHVERFNKASMRYRDEIEAFIAALESELTRAKAVLMTVGIAAATEAVDAGKQRDKITALRGEARQNDLKAAMAAVDEELSKEIGGDRIGKEAGQG